MSNINGLDIGNAVCFLCHPNFKLELKELTKHLFDKKGRWKKGSTQKDVQEYEKIQKDLIKNKSSKCLITDSDYFEFGVCKKHLMEVSENM